MSQEVFEWGRELVKEHVRSYPCNVYKLRRRHIADLLLEARKWQGREYLVHGADRVTFEQHELYVERTAARLSGNGIKGGDRVMLLAPNSVEWVVAFWAIARLGGIVVSANGWWSDRQVAHALTLTQPALVIADDRQAQKLPDVTPCLRIREIRNSWDSDTHDLAPPRPEQSEDAPAVILFTSGTTGASKGAVLSHRSQIANQHNLLAASGRLPQDLTVQSPVITTLLSGPLFHIGGIQVIMTHALTGGRIVMTEGRFDARQILRLIEQERIDRWGASPTMIMRILDCPDLASRDTSSLKSIGTGGTFVSPDIVSRMRQALPSIKDSAAVVYGLSEAGGTLCMLGGAEYIRKPTAAGRPFAPVEMRISNPDAQDQGEILARSATAMTGYLGLPDDRTVDDDGWLHTGDIGRFDDEGFLHVTGRLKDVIIRGGENISAANIENCLLDLPEIREVAVVGLDNPEWGEEVGVALVFKEGMSLTQSELDRHCRTALAQFEVPSRWWIRSEPLPTTDAGKVVKNLIKEEWPAANTNPTRG